MSGSLVRYELFYREENQSTTTKRQRPAARDAWTPARYTLRPARPRPRPPPFKSRAPLMHAQPSAGRLHAKFRNGLQHGRHMRLRAGRRRHQAAAAVVSFRRARACCRAGSHCAAGRCRRRTRATSASAALACAASSRHSAASGASACRAAPVSGPWGGGGQSRPARRSAAAGRGVLEGSGG